jgi:hypothetical protein
MRNRSYNNPLFIFDFDDTMVKTGSRITVSKRDGSHIVLTPSQYAVYDKDLGDVFDFSEFRKLINPREVRRIMKIFRNRYLKWGPDKIMILTARGSELPVKEFLDIVGLQGVEVVALNDGNPNAKSRVVAERIKKMRLDYVEFFDDSPKNVEAVDLLIDIFPHVEIVTEKV